MPSEELQIRALGADEVDAFVAAASPAFLEHPREERVRAERLVFEPDRSLAVFDRGRIVAGAIACTFRLSVPGGSVGAAGVTSVAVAPTHRRRGLLRALMRRQLDDVRERGEPTAVLWASEGPIYGRFGYGVASFSCRFRIERPSSSFRPDAPQVAGRMSLVGRGEALERFVPVYEAVAAVTPGFVSRDERWWEYRFLDLEHDRDGYSAYFFAVHEGPGGDDGYVAYRVRSEWDDGLPRGRLQLEELLGVSPGATAALWRYCFDMDLIAAVEGARRPVDDSLLQLLADPRRLQLTLADGLYVRLVDPAAALAARRYRSAGRLVVGVSDAFCRWNEGAYELEGGPDGASCSATGASPDLALDVAALGSAYLGGVTFAALARAGRVEERTPGAISRADVMFGSGVAPWCPHVF